MERVISMRCTQEQFDSIKDSILESYPIKHIANFRSCSNLTNYFLHEKCVSNINYQRNEHYETFNADVFLEACGVEVEKTWKGNELQFKDMYGKWIDCTLESYEFRLKPQPDYSQEIEALQQKAKENGMKVTINLEKL